MFVDYVILSCCVPISLVGCLSMKCPMRYLRAVVTKGRFRQEYATCHWRLAWRHRMRKEYLQLWPQLPQS